jgi:hypothetical protein
MTAKAKINLAQCSDPLYLLTLPKKERAQILEAQAKQASPLYEAGLAMESDSPKHPREPGCGKHLFDGTDVEKLLAIPIPGLEDYMPAE